LHAIDWILVALTLAASAFPLWLLPRHWGQPGVQPLFGMVLAAVTSVIAEVLVPRPMAAEVTYAITGFIGPLYALSVSDFFGMKLFHGRISRVAILGSAGLLSLMALTNDWHGWYAGITSPDPARPLTAQLVLEPGPGALAMQVLNSLLVLGTAAVVCVQFARSRFGASQLFATLVFPLLAGVGHWAEFFADRNGIPMVPGFRTAIFAGLAALTVTLLRQRILRIRPVSNHQLIERLPDAMAVVSPEGLVIDCNSHFADVWGRAPDAVIGQEIADYLPGLLSAEGAPRERRVAVTLSLSSGQRFFDVCTESLPGRGGRADHMLLLRDVTQHARMHAELAEKEKRLREANAVLEQLSTTDPLTGLKNRRSLLERLEAELRRSERSGHRVGLLSVDLDRFKSVNDTHGHETGDAALVAAAEAMLQDRRATDVVARFGGEEFVVLLVDADPNGLLATAERVRAAVAGARVAAPAGPPLRITASIGGALHVPGEDLRTLLARADAALYAAKDRGRNRCVVAETD